MDFQNMYSMSPNAHFGKLLKTSRLPERKFLEPLLLFPYQTFFGDAELFEVDLEVTNNPTTFTSRTNTMAGFFIL